MMEFAVLLVIVGALALLITDDHWRAIDTHERSAGEPRGRPRAKVVSVAELLRIAHG